ncbi:hypothetical protein [Maribacter dokdonensis]|uniref:hypothetical protein n=1 Tax=Maribacter dokdonensis TaxID=320912 RepID=UPI002733D528|nr:hypothetical protein [Maribacter dokdonensis]MDP2525644.1 hypothetical protein [Maribacter dokdonensis]
MRNKLGIIVVLIFAMACERNGLELTKENLIGPLEGSWEYFRGVELRCGELDEIGDFEIDNYNKSIWDSEGNYYREYMDDDGAINNYTGKWSLIGREDDSYIFDATIDGIDSRDTIYVLFNNDIFLTYDYECFDVPYEPYVIREAGEARRVD